MPRVVFDTVVFVRALLNPKSRCGRLFFERAEEYELVISPEIVREVLEVIRRPEITSKSPHFSGLNFEWVLRCFEAAQIVEPRRRITVCRDSADNRFIECAVDGGAIYLVSEDLDLLDLREYETVRIISSSEFLRVLDGRDTS